VDNVAEDRPPSPRPAIAGLWLTAEPVPEAIEPILLEMLVPTQPSVSLREAIVEELGRPAKLADVALEYLGLRPAGLDTKGGCALRLVATKPGRDPWREALTRPGRDCPIGFVVDTIDQGRLVLVHEVFDQLAEGQQDLVRRYAPLALAGRPHEGIVAELCQVVEGFADVLARARRQVQGLDPSVLFGPEGDIRVQLGSLSETTRNLLREGLHGEQVFILPRNLFESGTNYGDVEFLVYLNFFARRGVRTRILGTARQRATLERVLTLTIFGLFDPADPTPPALAALQHRYGVPDQATYDLFVAAYETFGVRAGPGRGNPMLTIDAYLDYTVLGEDETVLPIDPVAGSTVGVRPTPGGFAVRIVGANGRVSTKVLEVSAPHRAGRLIADESQRAIRFATDRPRFGVTPLGTSHGFDPAGDLTSVIVWINGKGILVDPSPEALAYLEHLGVAAVDVPYVFLTHVHADHDGGLLEKLLNGRRTTVIASDVVFRQFVEKAQLITGHAFEGEGLVKHVAVNPGTVVRIKLAGETVGIDTRWNFHPIPTNGFTLRCGDRTFGYSGDTKYDPALLGALRAEGALSADQYERLMHFFWTSDGAPCVDLLYHEAGIPPIHTDRQQLETLSAAVRARTHLVHIADRDVPAGTVPGKPRLFATHVLRPPTRGSRARVLLETIRLVGYLYDTPLGTLRELLRGADVLPFEREAVIIRKGVVEPGATLHFYVVSDGRVAVKDGRRVIAHLVKADSFGEWGISHQRGFRVADVVAVQPTQCLRFSETQYRWLVDRHPVIPERISRIRSLLPRLQVAQERARLKGDPTTLAGHSVLETMTSNQLAGFALFTEIRSFRSGDQVILEGDPADGFYTLLSGHLVATIQGRPVGELSEGDVFGEMGLLTGGTRRATITVVSADAEALFMSTGSFREMLNAMPAFAWGIWETVAERRAASRSPAADR
jgi:CRP-like cAMP-binding protein